MKKDDTLTNLGLTRGELFLVTPAFLSKTELKDDTYYLTFVDEGNRDRNVLYFYLYSERGRTSVMFTKNEFQQFITMGAWIKCEEDQIAKFTMLWGHLENY